MAPTMQRFRPSRISARAGTTSELTSIVTRMHLLVAVVLHSPDALGVGQKLHRPASYGAVVRTVNLNSVIIVALEGDCK